MPSFKSYLFKNIISLRNLDSMHSSYPQTPTPTGFMLFPFPLNFMFFKKKQNTSAVCVAHVFLDIGHPLEHSRLTRS